MDRASSPARIYKHPQSAMTSGRAKTARWVLEFEPAEARRADPLTGWAGSGDTQRQVELTFPDCDAAKAYAEKHGLDYRIIETPHKTLKIQAYADNFR